MSERGSATRTDALLARAAQICMNRGARLTELRREVLGLILESDAPVGAYDLLERLRRTRGPAAPPTIYRALDFLVEQGFVHRLQRLAAFVGCVADEPAEAGHAAQFLICQSCGRVLEMEDDELAAALAGAAGRLGFVLEKTTIEAEGLCAACMARPAEDGSCQ